MQAISDGQAASPNAKATRAGPIVNVASLMQNNQ